MKLYDASFGNARGVAPTPPPTPAKVAKHGLRARVKSRDLLCACAVDIWLYLPPILPTGPIWLKLALWDPLPCLEYSASVWFMPCMHLLVKCKCPAGRKLLSIDLTLYRGQPKTFHHTLALMLKRYWDVWQSDLSLRKRTTGMIQAGRYVTKPGRQERWLPSPNCAEVVESILDPRGRGWQAPLWASGCCVLSPSLYRSHRHSLYTRRELVVNCII